MQTYTIISITGPEHKREIARWCADQTQIHQSGAFLAFCADLHRQSLCAEMHGGSDQELGLGEALILCAVGLYIRRRPAMRAA